MLRQPVREPHYVVSKSIINRFGIFKVLSNFIDQFDQ